MFSHLFLQKQKILNCEFHLRQVQCLQVHLLAGIDSQASLLLPLHCWLKWSLIIFQLCSSYHAHTKNEKPSHHPVFPSHVRDAFCILQKKDKDTLHGSISRGKKKSVHEFGTRLGFSTSDSVSQFATRFHKKAGKIIWSQILISMLVFQWSREATHLLDTGFENQDPSQRHLF